MALRVKTLLVGKMRASLVRQSRSAAATGPVRGGGDLAKCCGLPKLSPAAIKSLLHPVGLPKPPEAEIPYRLLAEWSEKALEISEYWEGRWPGYELFLPEPGPPRAAPEVPLHEVWTEALQEYRACLSAPPVQIVVPSAMEDDAQLPLEPVPEEPLPPPVAISAQPARKSPRRGSQRRAKQEETTAAFSLPPVTAVASSLRLIHSIPLEPLPKVDAVFPQVHVQKPTPLALSSETGWQRAVELVGGVDLDVVESLRVRPVWLPRMRLLRDWRDFRFATAPVDALSELLARTPAPPRILPAGSPRVPPPVALASGPDLLSVVKAAVPTQRRPLTALVPVALAVLPGARPVFPRVLRAIRETGPADAADAFFAAVFAASQANREGRNLVL